MSVSNFHKKSSARQL